ncbi:phosphoribosylformylglycinamidine synthase subunit II [Leadbetterella byssophila DSM 17132]|uniref:Phosphoribosylformylglycinamidine synthase subunit PurL n=1 Tax=Leadbetterella byssophila (strain DSM 17132 / JCM 16389 / KACC 11308 / NBRC 106382 / 4M15) TaxID=649349 RepID=E4RS74_LEAB4|nr:phosphoribosylformylglycinamidine synthase subunit PurL [Leadbetterella byssophila]ADQ16726.1 phosphoribosylformylglycinamidine synthase subunit II [Leadbetterella byssophila DSM 17132]
MEHTESLPTVETAKKLGLLPEEFDKIKSILGRDPNFTELSIFSVMWSEHCSYKNSIVWLKTLPKESDKMLAKAGEENAGLIDIGDGLACSFKIESHNHPSALEPYQGAATGVGGINRDIFTMGARPIAQLNSLRFGNLNLPKTKRLLKGVVKGIGDYGNAFGVPTVGGELYFDECYNTNPLVNAFSAGILEVGKQASATSYGVGNPVYIVGSATGKDGIHGATFASEDITSKSEEKLPAVQVGDPFMEKLLLEATLEIINSGYLIGIQDMGAAGIICSTSEMSAKGEHGMIINLDEVPTRQENMHGWEILLSESQERMLVVIQKGGEEVIEGIFKKWDLHCKKIGEVTDTKRLHFYQHGKLIADVPAHDLVLGGGAPQYHREYKEPAYYQEFKKFDPSNVQDVKNTEEFKKVAKHLLSHPNIASRNWVYEQYDSMVGTANASTNHPTDAAVVRIRTIEKGDLNKGIVITVDCNGRYVNADPEIGTQIAVSEAARNIVCSGGEPLAITNNLNFGNPYNPEVYWQFVGAVKGMSKACLKFNTPVTGGNVSFYNQSSDDGPVFPTPTIGMLGLIEKLENKMTLAFQNEGDTIYLIGKVVEDLASSEYLYSYRGVKASPAPYFDLEEEFAMQKALASLIQSKAVISAHDLSDGGLYIALAEAAIANNLGFDVKADAGRKDAFWFGEAQGRVIVSVKDEEAFEAAIAHLNVPALKLGKVTNADHIINGETILTSAEANDLYKNSLKNLIEA